LTLFQSGRPSPDHPLMGGRLDLVGIHHRLGDRRTNRPATRVPQSQCRLSRRDASPASVPDRSRPNLRRLVLFAELVESGARSWFDKINASPTASLCGGSPPPRFGYEVFLLRRLASRAGAMAPSATADRADPDDDGVTFLDVPQWFRFGRLPASLCGGARCCCRS
jgi:hypothetical protein